MKKFRKEDLSTRHVVKIRNGNVCFIGEKEQMHDKVELVLYSIEDFGRYPGWASLENLSEELESDQEIYTIIAIKEYRSTSEAISAVVNEEDIDWDWERKELIEITSLDQLEGVRKELCEKYNTQFYITNQVGKWEIIFNGVTQEIGEVQINNEIEISEHLGMAGIKFSTINTTDGECGDKVYLDWEIQGRMTSRPFRAVDLEKEGCILKLT